MIFDSKPFIEAAKTLVAMDETERALHLLFNLPAYYRDNTPNEVRDLRAKILAKVTLPVDLLGDDRELPKSDEFSIGSLDGTMRGAHLKHIVSQYNDEGKIPFIVDMGPGDYVFPIGMHLQKLNFKYYPVTLNLKSKTEAMLRMPDKYNDKPMKCDIFVAYEIIEHLHHVDEIRQCFDRYAQLGFPDFCLLSTPKYTFGEGTQHWESEGIHHLRAYTPREFQFEAIRMFPEYNWSYADNPVMVLIGSKKS